MRWRGWRGSRGRDDEGLGQGVVGEFHVNLTGALAVVCEAEPAIVLPLRKSWREHDADQRAAVPQHGRCQGRGAVGGSGMTKRFDRRGRHGGPRWGVDVGHDVDAASGCASDARRGSAAVFDGGQVAACAGVP